MVTVLLFYSCREMPRQLIKETITDAHGSRGLKSMTIVMGSLAAGRHGAGATAEHLRQHKTEQESANWEWCGPFKPQSLPPITYLLQPGHASKSFPNSTINWGPSIQIHGPRRVNSDSNQHSLSLPPRLSLPSHQPLHFTLPSVLPQGLRTQLLALLGSP